MTELRPRSGLRRANVVPPRRKRNYLRRYAWTTILLGLCVGFAWVIRARAVDPDGLGRVLYLIHDKVWLPVFGTIWLKYEPFSLTWVFPIAVSALLILLEWLGLLDPIRSAQIRMLRWMLYRRLGRAIILVFSYIPFTGRARMARTVLKGEIDLLTIALKTGNVKPRVPGQLARLAQFRIRLERGSGDVLRDAELVVLLRHAHVDPHAATKLTAKLASIVRTALSKRFDSGPLAHLANLVSEVWLSDTWQTQEINTVEPILRQASRERQTAPVDPAQTALAVLIAVQSAGRPHCRALATAIAQRDIRIARDVAASRETQRTEPCTIDLEYWLAQIEHAQPENPETDALHTLEQPKARREIGERFALIGESA